MVFIASMCSYFIHTNHIWGSAQIFQSFICSYICQLLRYHNAFLEEGAHRSAGEIADAEGITRSFVNRNGS